VAFDSFATIVYRSTPQPLLAGLGESGSTNGLQRGSILTSDNRTGFDSASFLANAGPGRTIVELKPKETFFCQGDAGESVFYIQRGRARVTVVSQAGMEATITLLCAGEFVGEESLVRAGTRHMSTAVSITDCTALRIERKEMIRVMHLEHSLSHVLIDHLLVRARQTESDLIDQLFNSSEKLLARTLLLMARFGEPDEVEGLIPEITEERLAQMIGTPRTKISFFMNRFHEFGLIDYDGHIRVHKALLNAILRDQLPGDNASKPALMDCSPGESRRPRHIRPSPRFIT
jgi:CRP-like cAMP-binding protein